MRIKAYAITEEGGTAEPFLYDRTLGSRDVLVRITHCSLARGDIQYIDNDWGDARYPLVPGHEIIGIVEAAGSEVADLRTGDRVGIGYQQEACFDCSFCRQGLEQLCPSQKVIAVDCYGGLAEQIVVDGRFAFRLPPQLDSAPSTPLLSSGLTVYAGILRAGLAAGSRVAVLGAGGLGHLAIQFLHKMGHSVTAFSHSPAKRELIERMGGVFADSSDSKAPDGAPGGVRFHPVDAECLLRHRLLCENAEPTGPALPGGGAVDAAPAERRAPEQFSASHLRQLHRKPG